MEDQHKTENRTVRRRRLVALFIGLAVLVLAAGILIFSLQKPEETLKIGAILPLSGPAQMNGREIRDGLALAVDEVNAWGGINGRKLDLIIEDSRTDPARGSLVFHKIESEHRPVLYLAVLSSVATALAPLAEQNQVPLVGLVVMAEKFTGMNEWVFRYYPMAADEAPAIESIIESLAIKNLGMLYINDEYGRSMFSLLRDIIDKRGGTLTAEAFDVKADNYEKQIYNLRDRPAIYAAGYPSHIIKIFQQISDMNYQGLKIACLAAALPEVRKVPQLDGVYTAAPDVYNENYPFAKKIGERYQARYGRPLSHHAASGYDFIRLLAGLLEDRKISRENIRQALSGGFINVGAFGEIELKPGQRDFPFPLRAARIADGQIRYLQGQEPR